MNAVLIDKPKPHDIEAIRPHLRKHLRPFKFAVAGSTVTVQGKNLAEAKKRFSAMIGVGTAFAPLGKGR